MYNIPACKKICSQCNWFSQNSCWPNDSIGQHSSLFFFDLLPNFNAIANNNIFVSNVLIYLYLLYATIWPQYTELALFLFFFLKKNHPSLFLSNGPGLSRLFKQTPCFGSLTCTPPPILTSCWTGRTWRWESWWRRMTFCRSARPRTVGCFSSSPRTTACRS